MLRPKDNTCFMAIAAGIAGRRNKPQPFTHLSEHLIAAEGNFQKIHNANVCRPGQDLFLSPLNGLS